MQSTYPPQPTRRPAGPTVMIWWLALLLVLVTGALVVSMVRHRFGGSDRERTVAESRAITPRGDLAADELSTIELFRTVSPSVVHITSVATKRDRFRLNALEVPQGTGSGLIWDGLGHIVTNYHVVQGATRAQVTLNDNTVYSGKIIGAAPDKDLAVIRITAPADKLKPIAVGSSGNLLVGQKVFAIGNPFGLDQTLTTGVISGLSREIQSVTRRPIHGVIQTDASINPGNSGGPLLDSAGRLIGVNTAIYSPTGASAGIGFAVPVDTVNRIVPQLITHGKVVRPGLGIFIGNDQVAADLNLDGVLIVEVFDDTPAAAGGLRGIASGPNGEWMLGDIIVAVDGERVRTSNDLYRILDQKQVGDKVVLTVERDRNRRDVEVELQALR